MAFSIEELKRERSKLEEHIIKAIELFERKTKYMPARVDVSIDEVRYIDGRIQRVLESVRVVVEV